MKRRTLIGSAAGAIGCSVFVPYGRSSAGETVCADEPSEVRDVVVTVQFEQRILDGRRRTMTSTRFENVGRRPFRILRWLVFDPPMITSGLFRIWDQGGNVISYIGSLYRRRPPTPADYFTIRPGSMRLVPDLDISDSYDFPSEPQRLVLRYDVLVSVGSSLRALRSKCVEFDFVP